MIVDSSNISTHIKILRGLLVFLMSYRFNIYGGLCLQFENYIDRNSKLKDDGFCFGNIDFVQDYKQFITEWKHYSGNIQFPIPITDSQFTTLSKQYWNGRKWNGKQLELRLDLLTFIIHRLEELK